MKRQLFWWIAFVLMSTLLVGAFTNFKFKMVDIQVYDTYYVFEPLYGIILLTLLFGLSRYLYLLVRQVLK